MKPRSTFSWRRYGLKVLLAMMVPVVVTVVGFASIHAFLLWRNHGVWCIRPIAPDDSETVIQYGAACQSDRPNNKN
jgi:hypothetical protein